MSAKKNLTAKDLSEKFGFQISEKDLEPEIDKDNRYLNQMADLSSLIEKDAKQKQEPEVKPEEKPEPEEKTFAELFESRGAVTTPEKEAEKKNGEEKRKSKLVEYDDSKDFGAFFNLSSAKVEDKDRITLPDEDYQPFELPEEDLNGKKDLSFHGFDDLAKAFGGKKRKR